MIHSYLFSFHNYFQTYWAGYSFTIPVKEKPRQKLQYIVCVQKLKGQRPYLCEFLLLSQPIIETSMLQPVLYLYQFLLYIRIFLNRCWRILSTSCYEEGIGKPPTLPTQIMKHDGVSSGKMIRRQNPFNISGCRLPEEKILSK